MIDIYSREMCFGLFLVLVGYGKISKDNKGIFNCDLYFMRLKLRVIMGFIILVVFYCINNCFILVFILFVVGY